MKKKTDEIKNMHGAKHGKFNRKTWIFFMVAIA